MLRHEGQEGCLARGTNLCHLPWNCPAFWAWLGDNSIRFPGGETERCTVLKRDDYYLGCTWNTKGWWFYKSLLRFLAPENILTGIFEHILRVKVLTPLFPRFYLLEIRPLFSHIQSWCLHGIFCGAPPPSPNKESGNLWVWLWLEATGS